MREDIMLHNLDLLWNYPDARYSVDSEEKLHRVTTLFQGLIYSSNNELVGKAIVNTLQAAHDELKNDKKIYLTNCGKDWTSYILDAVRFYSAKFPVYLLTEKLLRQELYQQNDRINRVAHDILAFEELFPDSKVTDGVLKGMHNPKVLHWDENTD